MIESQAYKNGKIYYDVNCNHDVFGFYQMKDSLNYEKINK